jgi:CBS domain-containing protein
MVARAESASDWEEKTMGLRASDLMQTKLHTVHPDLSLPDLERAFLEARVTGFPVVENDRLVGVVSRSDVVRKLATEQSYAEYLSDYHRDIGGFESPEPVEPLSQLAARVGARLGSASVKDVMSGAPVTVSPDDPISHVARALMEHGIHRVLVTRDGRLEGIITSLDLVRLLADEATAPA